MKKVLSIVNTLRLAAFPLAYGLSGALIGGTLNRLMIADLGISATLVALLFAVPLLISPLRIWLGYRSDGFPILGKRREPYILLGGLVIGGGILGATLLTANYSSTSALFIAAGLAAFTLYGVGRSLSHNTFQALLTDRFSAQGRTRAITLFEVATLLGLVMGSGAIGKALEDYSPQRLVSTALGVSGVVLALVLLAVLGQEPRSPITQAAAKTARALPFMQVLREVVLPDPQVRRFFWLVIFTFVGTLAQDVLLEPYGALVLGMPVAETTRLTMYWGLGVMAAMLLSGVVLIRWLGHVRLMRIGIVSSMLVFAGLILMGLTGFGAVFKGLVFVMGVGTGLAGAGMLAGVISFTTPVRAGMLMGLWGFANMSGHAFGSLMGGMVVDGVRLASGSPLAAYASVFALEILMLALALNLTFKLDVHASLASQESSQLTAAAD